MQNFHLPKLSRESTIIVVILFILANIPITLYFIRSQQNIVGRAQILVCPVTQATCSWNLIQNATGGYHVKVSDSNNLLIAERDLDASTTYFAFPASPNQIYRCEVNAKNACGPGPKAASSLLLCPGLTTSPPAGQAPPAVPLIQPSTPIPSHSPTPMPTPAPTPIPSHSPTPTPTPIIQAPPIVTSTPIPQIFTPAPTPIPPPIIVTEKPPVITTLPPAGNEKETFLIGIMGTVFIIIGSFLFFL